MSFWRKRPRFDEQMVADVVAAWNAESRHRASDLMACHPELYFAVARLAAHDRLTPLTPAAGSRTTLAPVAGPHVTGPQPVASAGAPPARSAPSVLAASLGRRGPSMSQPGGAP